MMRTHRPCGSASATSHIADRTSQIGFTLVELLVVVAIIAVLIAILLPGMKKAREQAILTVCISQQHQIGVGMWTYATENEAWFPPYSWYPSSTGDANYDGNPSHIHQWWGTTCRQSNGDWPVGLGMLPKQFDNTIGKGMQPLLVCPADSYIRRYYKGPSYDTSNSAFQYSSYMSFASAHPGLWYPRKRHKTNVSSEPAKATLVACYWHHGPDSPLAQAASIPEQNVREFAPLLFTDNHVNVANFTQYAEVVGRGTYGPITPVPWWLCNRPQMTAQSGQSYVDPMDQFGG